MSTFVFQETKFKDVILITPTALTDVRGSFFESFKQSDFAAFGLPTSFVQENQSRSQQGVLRGMHWQNMPAPQGKLVRVLHGAIQDVVVDIRKGSPNFGQWLAVELSAENMQQLWIPPGFAHGFVTLTHTADVLYKTTGEYNKEAEGSFRWNDPVVGIVWENKNPLLSEKDSKAPSLAKAINTYILN